MEATECGAAALGIILGYYQLFVPLPELRQACGVSRDGSKASNLLKAAHNYGMKGKGFQMSLEALKELTCPYIVFWNFNHFLVVERFSHNRVYLNDPATGRRSVSLQKFDEAYTGVVLVIEPDSNFQPGGKQNIFLPSLWQRLHSEKTAIVYAVLAGLLLVISGLAIPIFTQVFVDGILIQEQSDWLFFLLGAMIFAAIVRACLTLLQLKILRRLRLKLSMTMSSVFLWHLLKLPSQFYAQRFAGEISDRVRINDQVAEVISGRLATTVIDLILIVFYGGILLIYDWQLTLIGMSFALLKLVTLQLFSRQRVDVNRRLVQEQGKVAGVEIAGLQSLETIKASALESDFFARWAGYYAQSINTQQQLGLTNLTLSLLTFALNSLTTILILVVGGYRVISGHLTIGMLIAFHSLMQSFQQPVNNLVDFGSTIQELVGNLYRLDDVLKSGKREEGIGNREEELSQTVSKKYFGKNDIVSPSQPVVTSDQTKLLGSVELRNISFAYSPIAAPLIDNFSLSIQPGQRIALIGGSGSGKSTIARLIAGLYPIRDGEILFDGKPRQHWQEATLTNSIAFVEQEIILFAGTVRDNLTLWDASIPQTILVRACKDAAIHEVIMALPGGYDAEITEDGANLSGGQRQRLEIARALVQNPRILIMDEATSALDGQTESIINQNLRHRGCTCIIAAHRLSKIRDCDEIILLSSGRVVTRGSFEQLRKEEEFRNFFGI